MVSRTVWKTWPSGPSYDINLGLRPRFLSTESIGPCFSHDTGDHDQILQYMYPQTSDIRRTTIANQLVDHSDVCWSIICRRCSNHIFILDLTPGFNGLDKDNCKTRRETFKFWELMRYVIFMYHYLPIQGVVSLRFRELSKICSRDFCIAEVVLLMIISSWNFVRVSKAVLWAHA